MATSDVVFLLKGERGWSVQLVGRYHDVLHRDGDAWRFHSRVAEFTDRRRHRTTQDEPHGSTQKEEWRA